MNKNFTTLICFFILKASVYGQLQTTGAKIIDDLTKISNIQIISNAKRSVVKPTACKEDTIDYVRYKASAYYTVTVSRGRGLGQLYSAPNPITLSGFSFYAFVAANPPSAKKMNLICNVYKAGADSLPQGNALRSDTITIDSTFGGGLLSKIEKHASFTPIILDSAYIITIETDSATMNAGIVTNNYNNGDGDRENLNCGSISGIWYNGRNLNLGGITFNADIILLPFVKTKIAADFSIKNNCYNLSDTVKFINSFNNTIAGSRTYNRYLLSNLAYYCNWWDVGNNTGTIFSVEHKVKYAQKQNYKVQLISFLYGYRGNASGCQDTAVKWLYFKPDVPQYTGSSNACIGDTANFTANSNDTGIVYEWFSKPNSPTPFFKGKNLKKFPLIQTDTFYLRANNNGCTSNFRAIILNVNNYPTILSATNDTICAGSKATLKGSTDAGNIEWFENITGGLKVFTGNVYQSPTLTADTFFYIQANNKGCLKTPRIKITATVKGNIAPVSPLKSNDTAVCLYATNNVNLTASATAGLTIRWFDVGTGGSPIKTGNNFSFTPTKREIKTIYVDAYNGQCGSTREPINITVDNFPNIILALNDTICKGQDSVELFAYIPYGEAHWYDANSGGNKIYVGERLVNYGIVNSKSYYLETVSGICKSTLRTVVSAIVNTAPTITKLTGDTICAKNRAILKSTLSGVGTVNWYDSDTSKLLLNVGKTYTTEVLNSAKKYFAEPTLGGCTGARQAVTPLVKSAPFSAFSFEVIGYQQVRVSPINAGSTNALQWDFGDGKKSNIPNVTHRYDKPGVYRIKLTLTSILNGCIDSTINTIEIFISSLNQTYLPALKIYPNPAHNMLKIEGVTNTNMFNLVDITGCLLLRNQLMENGSINIETLASGIYFIQIKGYKPTIFVKE